jgi:crotonobetainyl-CoA:carnitine CoA-transferase CaiB-like acyl-CoA transferase
MLLAETGAAGGDIMRTTIEGMDHPQIRFNGDVATYDDPELGPVEQLGPIAAMSGGAVAVGPRPWTPVDDARLTPVVPASVRPPLDGLVLLEAASMIATPIGSAILADLGVRVIKIEPIGGEPGRTLPFIKTLQGKESITVDIKAPEGREIVQQLAERADMFLHNYRPGVPEKLGIDDASLRARNPRLVYLYVGGYGKHGPCEKMPAYHPIAGAVCGNAARQAGRGALSNVPVDMAGLKAASLHLSRANEGHPDPVTGALAATALLVGIAARDRAGIGAEMTTSMLCASAHLFSGDWIRYDGRPPIAEVDSELLGTDALDRLYETSDGWLFVGVDSTAAYQRLVAAVEQHRGSAGSLAEERFSTVADRLANDDALVSALTEVFATDTADEWERVLLGARVGAARADRGSFASFQQAEIAGGRHALARRVSSPGRGEHWRASAVVDMRGVDELGGACVAGQHSRAILAELGYSSAQIDSLIERGIVGEAGER